MFAKVISRDIHEQLDALVGMCIERIEKKQTEPDITLAIQVCREIGLDQRMAYILTSLVQNTIVRSTIRRVSMPRYVVCITPAKQPFRDLEIRVMEIRAEYEDVCSEMEWRVRQACFQAGWTPEEFQCKSDEMARDGYDGGGDTA